jgi:hypothetical protein
MQRVYCICDRFLVTASYSHMPSTTDTGAAEAALLRQPRDADPAPR